MLPIEFTGFSGDCRITGRMTLFGDRLTDMLNAHAQYRLSHVVLEGLTDGHRVELESIVLAREDLSIALATGPRGLGSLRVDRDQIRMQLGTGPYVVAGRLHTEHGTDPIVSVMHRGPMVPLTDATIAFTMAGEVQVVDAETVIINRDLVDWISPSGDEADHFPDVQVREVSRAGRAKDLTGISPF